MTEELTNLAWLEGNEWYGWVYNPKLKRYYFDDIGYESFTDLFENLWSKAFAEFAQDELW